MCKVENCNNRVYCKGYCDKHFKQWKKYGKTLTTKEICQIKLNNYDNQIEYIDGYINSSSRVKCYCHRCNNYFERVWSNLLRHNTEYCCPICQTKLGQERSKANNKPTITPVEEREKQFIKNLSQKNNQLTYIGGYINSEKSVLLECNICGYRFKRNANGIRGKKNYTCPNCQEKEKSIEKEINQMLKQQSKLIIDLKKQRENNRKKEINKINRHFNNKTVYIKSCLCCGEEYIEHTKSKYCSKCRNRIRKKHSYKSLKQLYKRDKGICHICGGLCDWNDKQYDKDTIIVGETYPSIDHIIPISKGGTDEWNNLGLAHFKCNWVKGAY